MRSSLLQKKLNRRDKSLPIDRCQYFQDSTCYPLTEVEAREASGLVARSKLGEDFVINLLYLPDVFLNSEVSQHALASPNAHQLPTFGRLDQVLYCDRKGIHVSRVDDDPRSIMHDSLRQTTDVRRHHGNLHCHRLEHDSWECFLFGRHHHDIDAFDNLGDVVPVSQELDLLLQTQSSNFFFQGIILPAITDKHTTPSR